MPRKTSRTMKRQGDVLLIPITKAMTGQEVEPVNGRLVLAYGETEGHSHSLKASHGRLISDGVTLQLWMDRAGKLDHLNEDGSKTGEHDSLTLERGGFEIRQQVHMTPSMETFGISRRDD